MNGIKKWYLNPLYLMKMKKYDSFDTYFENVWQLLIYVYLFVFPLADFYLINFQPISAMLVSLYFM